MRSTAGVRVHWSVPLESNFVKTTRFPLSAAWVKGSAWGSFNGTLAVAALKGSRVVFMKFDSSGTLQWTRTPAVLRNYGRLRSVTRTANGDLLITTGNGTNDAILRVHPR